MAAIRLSIEPRLCGLVSIGTVAVIRLVSKHAQVDLNVAEHFVARCVFDAEIVIIPMPSADAASALVADLASLTQAPPIRATVED